MEQEIKKAGTESRTPGDLSKRLDEIEGRLEKMSSQIDKIEHYTRRSSNAVVSFLEMCVGMTTAVIVIAIIVGVIIGFAAASGEAATGTFIGIVIGAIIMLIAWHEYKKDFKHRDDPPTVSQPADIDVKK